MYLRTSSSGGRSYLQLVEGYREGGRVRQRVVAQLGRVDEIRPGQFDPLIRGLTKVNGGAPATRALAAKSEPVFDPARAFGDLYALHALWRELGLDVALRRALRSSRRQFDAEALVRTMVFNRLSDPRSKLGLLEWLPTVAMPECPLPTHQQLLRAMDALTAGMEAVEEAVCAQVRPLLDQSVSLVFYDLTTIRVYGGGRGVEDLRQYGFSKDVNGVERQFVLGVVQSADGIPLLHTVAPGNVGEASTLRPMLEHALKRFAVQQMVVVADRGLLNLDNVAEIEQLARASGRQVDFILAVPARRYKDMGEALPGLVFSDGVAEGRFAGQRLVVADDAERAAEQRAARLRKLEQVEALGAQLAEKLNAQDEGVAVAGRRATDRGAYARFARELKDRHITHLIDIDWKSEHFHFDRNETAIARAEALDGKLFLLTSLQPKQFDARAVIARYKALADIERGFRVLKSDIEIAPVHHRLETRLRAHALICFLALLLHRVMRLRLRAGNTGLSVGKALAQLKGIQQHRVTLDGRTHAGITRLSDVQRDLFDALKLAPPKLP